MNKYYLITECKYEGVMMTTNTVTIIDEFDTEKLCKEEIIKKKNKGWKIIRIIKGKEINIK